MRAKFKEFIAMRIERSSQEELDAQKMPFFAEVKHDDEAKKKMEEERTKAACPTTRPTTPATKPKS